MWNLKDDTNEAIDEVTVKELTEKFKAALDNDINTSLGITVLYDVLKAKTNDKTTKINTLINLILFFITILLFFI